MFFFFFFIGGILFWLLIGNRSTLTVRLDEAPFVVDVKGYRNFNCSVQACTFRIPFGEKEICIEREKYYPLCESLYLPWQKKYEWQPELTKIPEITFLEEKTEVVVPSSKFIWKAESKELFTINSFGSEEFVAKFSDIENPKIVPFLTDAFLVVEKEIYFADSKEKRKNRIYEGISPEIRVLSKNLVLMKDDEKLYQFSDNNRFVPLLFSAQLPHIAQCDTAIIYASVHSSATIFYRTSSEYAAAKKLVSARGLENFTLACGKNNRQVRILFEEGNDAVIEW